VRKPMSREFRLGVFIVGTLVIFAAGVFLIGSKESLFRSTYHLKAQFQNVSGLIDGADVRVGGIHKGTVRAIQLPHRPDEKLTVVMDLENATHDVIKKDSVASIKSEGLLGDKYVEISFGSPDVDKVRDGDTIDTAPPLDISDLITKTNQILDSAKDTMQNADSISTKVNNGQGSIGALINDKKVYQQVNAATEEAKAGATAFQENMEAIKHNFFLRGFFKKRGYEDAEAITKHQISSLPSEQYAKKFEYDGKEIFDKPDTAKLKNEKTLNEAGTFLQGATFGLVVVTASAGMKGDADKQKQLSEARATVVRDYLTKNFRFDDTRVKTLGLGKNPEAGDYRKVDILVYSGGAKAPSNQSTAAR
jgi:phospholipid/cholesterol/gamma-HCH transport system substrate-binding protein